MDLAPPLIVLAAVSVGVSMWDLHRRGSRDVLEAVFLGELGALLGAVIGLVVPGAFMLGCVGGAALAATRLNEVGVRRREALDARVASCESPAEVLLFLHDRVDQLVGKPSPRIRRVTSWVALTVLALVAVGVVGLGLTSGVAPITLTGIGLAFLPIATLAERAVERRERAFAQELLYTSQDPALPEDAGEVIGNDDVD